MNVKGRVREKDDEWHKIQSHSAPSSHVRPPASSSLSQIEHFILILVLVGNDETTCCSWGYWGYCGIVYNGTWISTYLKHEHQGPAPRGLPHGNPGSF
jgi:hypothetical protein